MPKQLSEAAAWRECAEWVLVGPPRQREFLCQVLHPSQSFQWSCGRDAPPSSWPLGKMHHRVSWHLKYGEGTLDNDEWPENNAVRSLFCLLMAHECEEEGQ